MAAEYVTRVVDGELDHLMLQLAAIAIEGPKGVGKTATAARRAATQRRLDDPAQAALGRAEPARLAAGDPPVLIDEWQRFPPSWDVIRRAVDEDPTPGRFLLTGSAIPADAPAHTGAGRIATLRMRPMTLSERGVETPTVSLAALLSGDRPDVAGSTSVTLADYAREIVASGFPGVRHLTGRSLRAQLDGYLQRIVERDFEEQGHRVRRPATLRAWLTAYAAATSTTASYETIRDAATSGHGDKPAKTTTGPYRDVLERLWIIDPVPAWRPTSNRFARLSAPPKHHLVDPALAARLVGADESALLEGARVGPPIPRDGTLLGALFEALVTLGVRVAAQSGEAGVGHLRTQRGDHEVDLIVQRADGRILAIEVKLARDVADGDVNHLAWLRQRVGDDLLDAVIVTTGPDAYRRPDGVAIVPAALLGP